ncbi:type I restriction endonuclease subunit R [Alkalicoccobacillus porphyridii]|uniref:Type I restriction enzyme endonuclease subunit n=1 Tax=Alkalicoccobacillus porphyridii TaxID=2597270 RepID=A0A554A1X5_9BACI|nr:type I restriction endonuclease subunit R [Alkalicoccobacillus porphyridii]TSB47694.1 type I restriction endonuclease subunit R [Alkalicoccobacillus porphyridii]
MSQLEYEEVEKPFIEQLQTYGYTYKKGSDLDSERSSRGSFLLEERLAAVIQQLNPWISKSNRDKVIKQLTTFPAEDTWSANKQVFEWLFGDGISVLQDVSGGKKNQTVRLFDFENVENNDFLVVNQISYENANGTIRPDIVLYVNGFPVVVIECKSPKLKGDQQLPEGVRQFERYVDTHERLFWYNQMLIVTSLHRARVGTLFAKAQHYGLWKDPYPLTHEEVGSEYDQAILVAGMLRKEALLDLMRNFIVFDGKVKKLARYQQYRAVNKAIERMEKEDRPELRGGVVWHTQGSGKSLTMVYLAMKVRRLAKLENPMLVIITDRQDLDDQITGTFRQCGFPNPTQASSVADLKVQLGKGPGTTVMTLIQKFQTNEIEDDFPIISESENIIVMTDESHRSQYKGLALNMRRALPHATFIGFTGTPIDKKKRSTTGKFGSYIDKYTIEQAVEDGATVPIFYESRLPSVQVKGDSLDEMFNRVFHEYDDETRDKIRQKHVNESLILTAPERMREIAWDLVKHFESHILVNGYKAQVVAVSREAAVAYKELIDEFAGGQFETAVIFSAGHNDKDNLRRHHVSKDEEKQLIKRFKQPFEEDKLAMIIVCDKLLTGFDAPIEQVMYLDKPIREHNLLQAIARTNRRYDENKTYGLIVDYFGVSRFLDEALEIFSANDVKGALHSISDELPRLEQRHRSAMRFFDGLSKAQREQSVLRLKDEDVRAQFEVHYKRFAESMDKVMPNPMAGPYLEDLKHVGLIRQLAKSQFAEDDGMDIADCGEKVRRLVYNHLQSNGIDVKKPVSVLSSKIKEELAEYELPESKAAKMEHALKKEISVRMDEDPVFYTTLREKIDELLERFKERKIEIGDLIDELLKQREEMLDKIEGKTHSGLDAEVEPFYNKLSEVLGELKPDEELKEIAKDIYQFLNQTISQIPDWKGKRDFKRKLNGDLKIVLLKKKIGLEDTLMLVGAFSALAERNM